MKLTDLSDNPASIRNNLQITGPGGATTGEEVVSVDSVVVTPDASTTHTETIKLYKNAVAAANVSVGGLQGTTQKIEVKTVGPKNCYWLPWGSGKTYIGTLGGLYDYFFTYTINGCGVFIGGTANAPIVAHANLESDRLQVPVSDAMGKLAGVTGRDAGAVAQRAAIMRQVGKAQAITYDQFYGNLGAALIDDEQLGGAKIEVVTPDQYLIRAEAGFGAVFGVKDDANAWKFYGNWGGSTRQIW